MLYVDSLESVRSRAPTTSHHCLMTATVLLQQAKAKIMVIRDIEREDIEFISKTLGCLPIAHIDHMRPEKLGSADLVEEVEVSVLLAGHSVNSVACFLLW